MITQILKIDYTDKSSVVYLCNLVLICVII